MEDNDVFTLPEYETSECGSPSNVQEVKTDVEDIDDTKPTTSALDDAADLNSSIILEANSTYCESVTSCSTGILTDTEHERHNQRVINIDETSPEASDEDEDEIFFGKENSQRAKRKRKNTEDEDEESPSESTDIILVAKGSGKEEKRPAGVLFSHEELTLNCEWMFDDKPCTFPMTRNKYDFANHVKKHTEHLKFLDNGKYQCQWKDCLAILEAQNCVFHLYFHAYHTALKCVGLNCAKRDSLKKCSFNPVRVNTFKTRETNRVCMWNNCRQSFVSMFAYEIHIDHHMEKFHTKANQYVKLPCEWKNCNPRITAHRKAMMIRHLLKHTQLKQVACPTCGDMFKTRSAFKTHCHRLKKDQDLQCNLCKKYFSTESLLHNHVQNHVYTKQCNICQAMCLSASTLATHIRYKHLDGQHHMFKCNQCDFRTISNYQLLDHKKIHLPKEKRPKLSCDYPGCQYTCLCRRTMYDHVKSKHEGSRYVCHVCSNVYCTSTALSKHLKKIHSLTFPAGTDRFRYRKDKEGNYRLQTVRYESIENEEERSRPDTPVSDTSSGKIPRFNLKILQDSTHNGVEVVLEPVKMEGEEILPDQ
ncbi:hypothetical protein M8J76_003605 [Diaphorina citri]|nr:hypothetical protein M8J75_012525 [Diaphorina citri]KAI5729537.1 hypothetical protein M8J76_003605 [Diaphorina citri]